MPEQKTPSRPFFVPKDMRPYGQRALPGENGNGEWDWALLQELVPNMDDVAIEDDTPLDTIQTEKQQRLLTEPLYSSWAGPGDERSFLVMANVGLFYQEKHPPLVPDVMLVLDVLLFDFSDRENRTYCVWKRGKSPDVALEIVSDRLGGEETHKFEKYARAGVPYYVVYDSYEKLKKGKLRAYLLHSDTGNYEPTDPSSLKRIGLGLILWEGEYEGHTSVWLRWCDHEGKLIATGRERVEQEHTRAEGEHRRAEQERQRAEQERQRREQLEAKLRELGIDPTV